MSARARYHRSRVYGGIVTLAVCATAFIASYLGYVFLRVFLGWQ
jgi:hypothetical protein